MDSARYNLINKCVSWISARAKLFEIFSYKIFGSLSSTDNIYMPKTLQGRQFVYDIGTISLSER